MKVLPHYIEDNGAKCSGSISLTQNMGVLSKDDAKTFSNYMESCAVIDEWLSNIEDPVSGQFTIPSRTWSDGEYVWDSSHIHYVKNYRVRLPGEFLDHINSRIEERFDVRTLDKTALRAEFEVILDKLNKGDESYYAVY